MPLRIFRPRRFLWLLLSGTAAVAQIRGAEGASSPAGSQEPIPRYEVGQQIEADVVTPIALVVFDPNQSEALRQSEAQKVPLVFRYNSQATDAAEAELRKAFAERREHFVRLIRSSFERHPLRTERDLQDPRLAEAIVLFRSRYREFPLTGSLAELWALGDAGDVVLEGYALTLRRLMAAYIREDRLPAGERLGPAGFRLVRAEVPDGDRSGAPEVRTIPLNRTNFYALARIKQEVLRLAPAGEQSSLEFLTGMLRPNCLFDAEGTASARERRVQALNVLDQYAAGQTLALRGQTVDAKLKLALDELRARTEALRLEKSAAELRADVDRIKAEAVQLETAARTEQLKAQAATSAVHEATLLAERRRRQLTWGGAVVGAACLGLALAWWHHRRQQKSRSTLGLTLYREDDFSNEAQAWRERALAAEARAEKAATLLRASVLPHLARWMMTELVQRLLSQKSEVQNTQQRAEREVADLAERLEKLHAPLEERLRTYERRIAELESELAARDQQHHELIQAQIESTRRKLEHERGGDVPAWG